MKSEEEMESRSEKKGMDSAMTQAMTVRRVTSRIQVIQPRGVLM